MRATVGRRNMSNRSNQLCAAAGNKKKKLAYVDRNIYVPPIGVFIDFSLTMT